MAFPALVIRVLLGVVARGKSLHRAVLQKNFLLICFENYYEEKLEFSDDIPVTTKRNKQFHGFGLKSLRYTVRKYGGEINISTEDSWFTLKILIPYP